jgi:general secretion pathway protein K
VALLTLVASGLSASMRSDLRVANQALATAQARHAAEGGVYRALYEMLVARAGSGGWRADATVHELELAGASVRVTISDEAGKIDLNAASPALLEGLLASADVPDAERRSLIDAILDWRDADHDVRPYGAEDSHYRSQGKIYGAKDAPFDSVDELQLVLGMSLAVWQKLKPLLTVHSRQPGVNPAAASREVLLAIPGVDPAEVERYLASREQPPVLRQEFVAPARNSTVSIHAQARARDGASAHVTATVSLAPPQAQPFTLRDWRTDGPELFTSAEGG